MCIRRNQISSDNLTALNNILEAVNFTSDSTRLGSGQLANISVYEYSKWKKWNRTQRSNFKACFEADDINKAVIGWFLKFPANTGFLDTINDWDGAKSVGTIVAYSLTPNNTITIDGDEITVEQGHGVEFSLTNPHSVSTSTSNSNWACLMLMK